MKRRVGKSKVPRFYGPRCMSLTTKTSGIFWRQIYHDTRDFIV